MRNTLQLYMKFHAPGVLGATDTYPGQDRTSRQLRRGEVSAWCRIAEAQSTRLQRRQGSGREGHVLTREDGSV